jgi:hypothetical protein
MPKQDADRAWVNRRIETVQAGIDSHTANTSNPHSVTATQVGKDTAQWNADELQGVAISASAPSSGQVLKYNGSAWAPAADDTGGGGSLTDGDKGDITVSSSGAVWTIDNSAVTNAKVATGIDSTKLADGSVTNTELQYINTLSSNAQTQLDGKAATSHTHTASEITDFSEAVDDRVSSLVVAGTGITSTYNDVANTLTVATTITQYTDENAQDAVGAMVDTTLTYVDGTPLLQRAALTGDVTCSAGSNTTAIASGVIVNADVNASAAIAVSKLAALTASRAMVTDGSGFSSVATTTATELGYVNGVTSAIQTQIDSKAPTASPTFTGTVTLPAGQVVNGVTLTTGGSTSNFLNADGAYSTPSAGGVSDGDKGDITVSASGTTWTIDNDAVTYAKIQNITDARLLGRSAGSTGDCQEITVGAGLSLSAGSLTATGGGTGDVVGPVSATDNALARFDSTTGKLIQNSASVLSDDGALTLANNSGANTGMVAAYNWIRLASDYTLTSQTAAQKLFNASTNGALTLPTGVYFFEAMLYLTTMSGTSGNAAFQLRGAGTATLARILYQASGKDSTTPLATGTHNGTASVTQNSAASMVAVAVGTGMEASLRGTFDITAGGTIIPSIALVTAAAAVVKAGSYFKCWRAGDTATNTLGAWT